MTDLAPIREMHSIELTIPRDKLGELMGMFDRAHLGSSLRQSYTLSFDKPEKGFIRVGVAVIEQERETAQMLVKKFEQVSWADNPRIEITKYDPPTPEAIVAAQAAKASMRQQPL